MLLEKCPKCENINLGMPKAQINFEEQIINQEIICMKCKTVFSICIPIVIKESCVYGTVLKDRRKDKRGG
jgi:phage FluMu protein Com